MRAKPRRTVSGSLTGARRPAQRKTGSPRIPVTRRTSVRDVGRSGLEVSISAPTRLDATTSAAAKGSAWARVLNSTR